MKFKIIIFNFFFLSFLSCKNVNKVENTSIVDSKVIEDYDIIDLNLLKIEEKAYLFDKKETLLEIFGKPNERVVVTQECASFFHQEDSTNYFYYGNPKLKEDRTSFEMTFDSLALRHYNFRDSNKKLFYPNLELSKSTKLSDLKSIFPKSFKGQYGNDKKTNIIVVPLLTCKVCDDKIFLIFENELLIGLDYYMDC